MVLIWNSGLSEVIGVRDGDLGSVTGNILESNGELDSPGLSNSSLEGCAINERNIDFRRRGLCRDSWVVRMHEVNSGVSIATRRRNLLDTSGSEQGVWQRFGNGGGYPEDRRIVRTELKCSPRPVNQRIVLDEEIVSQDYNAL